MSRNERKTDKSKQRVRNLIRGAVSSLKAPSTPEFKTEKWRQLKGATQQVNKALSLAKQGASVRQLQELEEWIGKQGVKWPVASNQIGTALTSLGLIPLDVRATSLASEIRLAGTRLAATSDLLIEFASKASAIEHTFLAKDWPTIIDVVDSITNKFGFSYWAVETKLAAIHASLGIEQMKAAVTSLSIGATGVNKFLIYFIGVRNESAQTPTRFTEIIKRRLDDPELEDGIKSYFRYRLIGELPLQEKLLRHILAAEQLTTGTDLFFASIKTIYCITRHPKQFSKIVQQATAELAATLAPIAAKLSIDLRLIDGQTNVAPIAHFATKAMRHWRHNQQGPASAGTLEEMIVNGLVSRLSTRSDGVAGEDLLKLQINWSCSPTMLQLGPVNEVENLPNLLVNARTAQHRSHANSIAQFLEIAAQEIWSDATTESTDSRLKALSNVKQALSLGQSDDAIRLIIQAINISTDDAIHDALVVVAASIQCDSDDIQGALRTIAEAGLANEKLLPLLPNQQLFQGVKWSTLSKHGPSIELSICLDFYLRIFDDAKVRTYKRFSIEELLKQHQCTTLRSLLDALLLSGTEIAKLEYLFHDACDVYTIELLPGMTNSTLVLQERASILRRLAEISDSKQSQFLVDAREVEFILSVNEGLDSLDDSRVYVDEPRLLNTIAQSLSADFQRYKNLVAAGIGVSDSFDDVVREMRNPTAKIFQIPKNDADDLMTEIVLQMREHFLFDPAYGLDIHLSRRIRHGTISSQIRGPLERMGLIGQRRTAGAPYEAPDAAKRACTTLEKRARDRTFAAFARFSETIDQHIASLKDEYFQIKDEEKPHGVFELTVHALLLGLARSLAQACPDITEFGRECIGLFWFTLAQKVAAQRRRVELESKKILKAAFAKLTQDLRSTGLKNDPLSASIQQAAEELRNRVTTVANWIRVPNTSVDSKSYSMRRILDISIAAIKGQRPGFSPIVKSRVPDNFEVDSYGLSLLADMLYIALDNVCEHSGKKIDNEVDIDISFDSATKYLSFSLTSQVTKKARTNEKLAALKVTREKISRKAFGEGARSEGRSGLLKIAALVLRSENATISFGFPDDQHFRLEFSIEYTPISPSAPLVSANGQFANAAQGLVAS